jgi:hypothetical protein
MHGGDRRTADGKAAADSCDPNYNGIPFLNTSRIHCEATVREMLA